MDPSENRKFLERPYQTTATSEKVGRYDHREDNDDYTQAGNLWRLFGETEKRNTAKAIAGSLGQTPLRIQKLQLSHFKQADPQYASYIVEALGTDEHPEYQHGADVAELAGAGRLHEK